MLALNLTAYNRSRSALCIPDAIFLLMSQVKVKTGSQTVTGEFNEEVRAWVDEHFFGT